MRKQELSKEQLRDIDVFNLILDCYGWEDTKETETRLHAGELVNPEGLRFFYNYPTILQARFHAPVNMISLRVTDTQMKDQVQFHFLYDNRPERILEWIVMIGDRLNLETYPDLLKSVNGKCEMILLEVSDTEIYEVKPPA